MTTPTGPPGLGDRGRRFWLGTTGDYELSAAELELLAEVCRTLDTLDRLAEVVETDGPMTAGAAGQPVLHPAVGELRGQRSALHRLLAALALPDAQGAAVPSIQTIRGRKAADARWGAHRARQAAASGTVG